ncbi:MAG: terpene cyclase/mutase family protein [Planctomycetia bacterium]|jgi:hypothetical protein
MARRRSSPISPKAEKKAEKKKSAKEKKQEPKENETTTSSFVFARTLWARYTSGWLSSALVHLAIILILAAIALPNAASEQIRELFSSADEQSEELEEMEDDEVELDTDTPLTDEVVMVEDPVPTQPESISNVDDVAGAAVAVDLSELGFEKAPQSELMATVGAFSGKELGGRGQQARGALVARGGGNKASEEAVGLALLWLAEHQMPDGGWTFQIHLHPRCAGQCRNSGTSYGNARAAATGLALMPFLSAGETHKKGKYKKVVKAGLMFLLTQMDSKGSFADNSGNMYSHGIASITLCEAYAMTKDPALMAPAQQSINYICQAQDPVGGGWRYRFQTPGDTSVVGWQLMALKSAHLAYLKVPGTTIKKATKFLDSVQANGGANYGYTSPRGRNASMTPVGLLCRMYLGWQKDNPNLKKGVKWVSQLGPSLKKNDHQGVYYNYYATQVMHHWGGEMWDKWNRVMRDHLIETQAKEGHERGSWYSENNSHGQKAAGRLYCTCLNTMILEIYYRYLPLYQKESTTTKFIVE